MDSTLPDFSGIRWNPFNPTYDATTEMLFSSDMRSKFFRNILYYLTIKSLNIYKNIPFQTYFFFIVVHHLHRQVSNTQLEQLIGEVRKPRQRRVWRRYSRAI